MAVGCLGSRRRSGTEWMLPGVSSESGASWSAALQPEYFGEHKITNLFTVGPRLGYAWDRLMIFATGGYASANLKGAYCSVSHLRPAHLPIKTVRRATPAGMLAAGSTTWSTRARWST